MSEKERVSKRLYERWAEQLKYPTLKGKLSFEDSYQLALNRCMLCLPEEFNENVHRLFYSTPPSWKDDELWEALEECTEEFEVSSPSLICCGHPVKDEASPWKRETIKETNYHKLFSAILACADRRNLLIPKERAEAITEED